MIIVLTAHGRRAGHLGRCDVCESVVRRDPHAWRAGVRVTSVSEPTRGPSLTPEEHFQVQKRVRRCVQDDNGDGSGGGGGAGDAVSRQIRNQDRWDGWDVEDTGDAGDA